MADLAKAHGPAVFKEPEGGLRDQPSVLRMRLLICRWLRKNKKSAISDKKKRQIKKNPYSLLQDIA